MLDVVTLGEGMILLIALSQGRMRHVHLFQRSFAGAELNVAIGLVRLGLQAGWISQVGADEFGAYLLAQIRGEGVDVSRVRVDPEAPTGVYFKEFRRPGETHVWYYRRGSAASRLAPDGVDWDYVRSAKIVHLTGITPALSDSCAATVRRAIAEARAAGVQVSFDPNIRLKLWTADAARRFILDILPQVDIVLPGLDEARLLVGPGEPEALCRRLLEKGPSVVGLKMGATGAVAADAAGVYFASAPSVTVVDTIGAGDGFAAAFLACYLKGYPLAQTVSLAAAAGALVTTVSGDIEGLPTWDELVTFAQQMGAPGDVR
jgi:2-dehydro-3-deoxygluconokinase